MEFPPPPTSASSAASASTLWSGQAPSSDKSSQLLIREYPNRSIAIVSQSHALIFRHSHGHDAFANGSFAPARPRPGESAAAKCIVEFSPNNRKLLSEYRPLTPRPIYGTLGLLSIGRDVFICVITQATRVATLRPGETIERIAMVEFFCLTTNEYDHVLAADPSDLDEYALSRRDPGTVEHPCQEVQKLLSNGSFYYSTDFDLTNRLQDRSVDACTFDMDNFDESFLWNSYMIDPLVQFRSRLMPRDREALDAARFLTSAIRGFCLTMTIPQSSAPLRESRAGMPSYLTVISRLSCRRAGTRFNSRGIDDDGNVANFVETETIYWSPSGVVFSYAQVRGSVPIFWEQAAGLLPGHQKITVTRSPDGAQPAFNKHFEELEQTYGAVHVINLLSESKPGEVELSQLFRYGIQHCPLNRRGEKQQDHALLRATEYDFHAETKGPQGYEAAQQIRGYIESSADGFAYYLAEAIMDGDDGNRQQPSTPGRYVVVLQQEGVFRTNCLDCLDRTNLIQTNISKMAVETFLDHRGNSAPSDFWMRHSSLWADNGDSLSRIYAGTGALKSSFTRHGKMSLAGAIADARKSATRLYINNFADKARQNTIDVLLGRIYGQTPVVLYDPISDYVAAELSKRNAQFSTSKTIKILVGTFNLNGRTEGIQDDLSAWLRPPELGSDQPDIVAVGFQEIVELSPQQIMNSDPRVKQLWENAVKNTLNLNAAKEGREKYLLLRSGQLVGAALCIFVKASALKSIKNVEGSVKKTGMSGMAGNKGAVAIRLDYANTQICFVTAHLAAGFGNYDERNKDYATIHHGLRFQRNRGIDDHDTVIWLGDFNYRIGLSRENALELIRRRDLPHLYENDQLNLQMVAGLAFQYYSEARINFLPTYKFDLGRDEYDSSEKARIPAWTDRILRKGSNIRQLSYNSAPLRFSDHRPVYATFECTVNIVDEALREKFSREIYDGRRADVGDVGSVVTADDTDDEDLLGYDSIEPGLPPASSDRQKWWLDNGRPARSAIVPPKPPANHTTVLNPNRPANPFASTEEPDWVTVPRAESRLSSFSSISTSPYEHVNHSVMLSSSASSQPHRKLLPPPFDPSSLPGRAAPGVIRANTSTASEHESVSQQRNETPPPPPPRRQTSSASAAAAISTIPLRASTLPAAARAQTKILPLPDMAVSRKAVPTPPPPRPASAASSSSLATQKSKAPPPVAKKPAHLATISPAGSPTIHQSSEMAVAQRSRSPAQASTSMRESAARLDGSTSRNQQQQHLDEAPADYRRPFTATSKPVPVPPRKSVPEAMPIRRAPVGVVGAGVGSATGQGQLPPVLPARKPTVPLQKPKPEYAAARHGALPASETDLLGDSGNVLTGWKTLKPT
ncbi:synaptojanin 2 [Gaeumannomyces tritici R3-111a-1]|uniref:phosphoinositide 5-phosphatase n=1 Tax=Gaeumannomyces tritici (strain R3-111a-1) TaxID=644352 RepID=J3P852_GAET3|nr:synaptojanin 2 [Gaeumannomyces tritici R3-111a-1]EJT72835.1 synaptojanin 2 [Gaeumannomyces tritici R3-111a-1]